MTPTKPAAKSEETKALMPVEYTVISIGTLSRNRLWSEAAAMRTAHATTTLVVESDRSILVDPSLPGQILEARFQERTGRRLADVTDVFCTTLRPVHRRGLAALGHAKWWCAEQELETYRDHLQDLSGSAERLSGEDLGTVEADLKPRQDILEVADVGVPGHDNMTFAPRRWM